MRGTTWEIMTFNYVINLEKCACEKNTFGNHCKIGCVTNVQRHEGRKDMGKLQYLIML